MNQIILASHGGLAAGAKDTLEMVLGDVSNVHVVSLARDDKEPITNKVDAMIATFNADDTVYVLTDMLGSSVNNNMVELSKNGTKFTVVSGFNIPLALTLAMSPVPVKGAELAALINEARTGLTNPNAPVEVAAAPAKKAKASRHSSGPAKIVLARLDYRLLHGQVVFTWTTKVQAERIIVVDNAAANDDIKKGALKLAKPQGVRLNVFTVERALAKMDKLNTLGERVMFVFGNTAEMLQFCQGYKLDAINLGATANHDGADQVGGKDSSVFLDANQNRSHDEFARRIRDFGATWNSFGTVAHSQGGAASLHLYTYYWSGLDNAVGARRMQSVGTPYQGTNLAGVLAALGGIFGVGCGTNSNLTYSGAASWLAGIPTAARGQVNYYSTAFRTTNWYTNDYCNFASDLVLSDPEDGTVERSYAQLPGGINRGHVSGQCHTNGMRDPAQYLDASRNSVMNANAAR